MIDLKQQPIFVPALMRITLITLLFSLLASCSLPAFPASTPPLPTQTNTPILPEETVITFRLTLDQPLPPGESLFLSVLDEVSGLAFNPKGYVMSADDATHYTVIVPSRMGSIVKYRYVRQGSSSIQEHISDGRPVRYRLYHVQGPGVVEDTISRWTDTIYNRPTGRIMGQIIDTNSGQPVPNLLMTAGGIQTFTTADGYYLLEGLPPGTHNLVAYALDGMYYPYEQGAVVAADSTTPASFGVTPTKVIPVIFSVSVPETTPSQAPLRLAGNLFQLGNTFADLSGGISTLASRMPVLSQLPDGRYSVTVNLPVGAYIEYKYTLGDGLWNAEHTADGALLVRAFIVPDTATEINDIVVNWGTKEIAPIRFDVTVPAHTPSIDGVSIQFNPGFGWLQPLPMWQALDAQGKSIWRFTLISPLEVLETIQYRICRADQCGIADDVSTQGMNVVGHIVNTGMLPQTIVYNVTNWVWFPNDQQQASVPNISINPRGTEFIAGISLDPSYQPSWFSHIINGIDVVSNLGANWIIFQPTWTFTRNQPLVFEIVPSQDIMWYDFIQPLNRANDLGMNIGLFPTPHFPQDYDVWWQESPRDFTWWVQWFDRYAQFLVHHSDLARQSDVDSMIIGGDWIKPALPNGTLQDNTPSGVPEDAEYRWRNLIELVREHYQGTLIWALCYPECVQNPVPFINDVDQIMILWSPALSSNNNASVLELSLEVSRILDQELLPLAQNTGKKIILSIRYPSADGSSTGCISISSTSCIPIENFTTTHPQISSATLDLQEQANIYNAILLSINERDWISGVISMDFYPPVALHDPSSSIYDKPASGVLWYWFPRLTRSQP